MSYFTIAVSDDKTSADLYHAVQKYIHMIELYHLNLKSNIADFDSGGDEDSWNSSPEKGNRVGLNRSGSVTGALAEKKDLTIKELLKGSFKNSTFK